MTENLILRLTAATVHDQLLYPPAAAAGRGADCIGRVDFLDCEAPEHLASAVGGVDRPSPNSKDELT